MTDRILKVIDGAALAILAAVMLLAFLFPAYAHNDAAVFYRAAIGFAGFLFILRIKVAKSEEKIETPIDPHMFLLFAWTIISAAAARDKFASFDAGLGMLILMLFFYLAFGFARRFPRQFVFFLAGTVSMLALYGLYQYFFGFAGTLKYLESNPGGLPPGALERIKSGRVFSTLIYPNSFAGLLVLAIPVVMGLIKNERKLRPVFIAALLLLAANLYLTKSLGAFISLIAAAALVFFSAYDPALKTFKTYLLVLAAAAAAVFAAVLVLRGPGDVLQALAPRFESWLKMLDISRHYLLTGAGPGSFEAVYNNGGFSVSPYLKYAHNAALQALIELGLPGFVIILFATFYAVRSILQNFYFTRTPQRKVLVASLLTGIMAFLLHNLADFDIYNFELSLAFLFALALLLSQMTIGSIEIKKIKLTYLLGLNPGKRRSIIFAAVLAVLLLSVVTGGKFPPVLSAIYAVITAGLAIWSVSKEDIRATSVDIPLFLIGILSSASLFYTPDLYTGLKYLTMYAASAALFYLCSQFLRRYTYRIVIMNFIIWAGVALSAIAMAQYVYRLKTGAPGLYADCFFPNSNIFAAYMCVPYAFLLSRILFEKRINFLFPKTALLFVFIAVLGLAYSKAGMLTCGALTAAIWIYYGVYRQGVKDTEARSALKTNLMRALAVFILLVSFTDKLPSGRKITGAASDVFLFNRAGIYNATREMIREKPALGWGLGSYGKVFPRYNFPAEGLARYQHETPFAHNDLLQAGQALGLIGLALVAWLMISLFLNTPEREGHRKLWAATTGAYFGLGSLLLGSMFHFHMHVPGMVMTAAVLAAMFAREKYAIRTIPKEALFFTKIHYFPALIFAFILLSIAVKPALSWFINDRYDKTKDYKYLAGGLLVEPSNPSYNFRIGLILEESSSFKDAIGRFKDSLAHDPYNYITLLHAARVSRNLGDYPAALKYYSFSLEANPYRVFTLSETANFYRSALNDPATAESYFLKAVSLEPNYTEARHSLALLRMQRGLYREAMMDFDAVEEILSSGSPLTPYEKSLLSLPLDALYYNKATLLKTLENFEESCYYYKKSYGISRKSETLEQISATCKKGAQ
jgi:O-antigen ligase